MERVSLFNFLMVVLFCFKNFLFCVCGLLFCFWDLCDWVIVVCVLVSHQRARPIIVDPGLYMNKKQDVFWVTQRRSRPTAFKLFTGEDPFLVC